VKVSSQNETFDYQLENKTLMANIGACVNTTFTNALNLQNNSFYGDIQITHVALKTLGANDLHISVACSSKTHHVVNLHNRIRSLTKNMKFNGFSTPLVAYNHGITDDIDKCFRNEYHSNLTAAWDNITLVNLQGLKNPPKGGPQGPGTGGGQKGNGTSGGKGTTGAKTYTASVTAEMNCSDADQVILGSNGTKAFEEAFNKVMKKATLKNTKLEKVGCSRRLNEDVRRLSTTGVQGVFTYTSTTDDKIDANAFKSELDLQLTAMGLPKSTKVTSQAPVEQTKTSSAMKSQAVSFFVAVLLAGISSC